MKEKCIEILSFFFHVHSAIHTHLVFGCTVTFVDAHVLSYKTIPHVLVTVIFLKFLIYPKDFCVLAFAQLFFGLFIIQSFNIHFFPSPDHTLPLNDELLKTIQQQIKTQVIDIFIKWSLDLYTV